MAFPNIDSVDFFLGIGNFTQGTRERVPHDKARPDGNKPGLMLVRIPTF